MVPIKALLFTLALFTEAWAKPTTTVTCSTKLGSVVVKHPKTKTSTTTKIVTHTKKITKKQNKTVTPKEQTIVITATRTRTAWVTAGPETKTATTTVSDISTTTESITITDVENETTTVETTRTTTSTIAAPASFTPISKNPDYVAKRAAPGRLQGRKGGAVIECGKGGSKPIAYPPQYPQAVSCVRKIIIATTKTITTTVPGRTITLAPHTKTKSTTITQTAVRTKYPPDVSETITETTSIIETATEVATTTTTLTSTSTIEIVVPTTFYEACGPDNMISSANGGQSIFALRIAGPSGTFSTLGSGYSPYSCCVACFTTTDKICRGSFVGSLGYCSIFVGSTCTPNQFGAESYLTSPGGSGFEAVSNGPCGLIANGG